MMAAAAMAQGICVSEQNAEEAAECKVYCK
jgi:hypothetical protein